MNGYRTSEYNCFGFLVDRLAGLGCRIFGLKGSEVNVVVLGVYTASTGVRLFGKGLRVSWIQRSRITRHLTGIRFLFAFRACVLFGRFRVVDSVAESFRCCGEGICFCPAPP